MTINIKSYQDIARQFNPYDRAVLTKGSALGAISASKSFAGKAVRWIKSAFNIDSANKKVRANFRELLIGQYGKKDGLERYKKTCAPFFSLRSRPLMMRHIKLALKNNEGVAAAPESIKFPSTEECKGFMRDICSYFEKNTAILGRKGEMKGILEHVGLFREPGNKVVVGELCEKGDFDSTDLNPNDLCSAFKALAGKVHEESKGEAGGLRKVFDDCSGNLRNVEFPAFDELNKTTKQCLKIAQLVVDKSDKNLMGVSNMAMCFWKPLLGSSSEASTFQAIPFTAAAITHYTTNYTKALGEFSCLKPSTLPRGSDVVPPSVPVALLAESDEVVDAPVAEVLVTGAPPGLYTKPYENQNSWGPVPPVSVSSESTLEMDVDAILSV